MTIPIKSHQKSFSPPSPPNFSASHKSFSSHDCYCYLKRDIKVKKKSLNFEQQNEAIVKGILKIVLPTVRILRELTNCDYESPPQLENF